MQKTIKALQAEKYLSKAEINAHLDGVEYIIMAAPTTRDNPRTPIHFSNTRYTVFFTFFVISPSVLQTDQIAGNL